MRPIEASLGASLVGRYVNDRLGTIAVTPAGASLALRLGVSPGRILWTGGDTFIASVEPDPGYESVRFERDGAGNPIAFVIDGDRYVRQPG